MSQQNWNKPENNADDDVQMPLGVGGGAEEPSSEESYSPDKPKINTSTMALFAAFAAALAVLYLLGLQNKPRAASAEAQDRATAINESIEKIIKDHGASKKIDTFVGDTSRLVKILMTYLSAKPQQNGDIPNVFEAIAKPPEGHTPVFTPVDNHQQQLLLDTSAEFKSLKLQMISYSPKAPSAIINGHEVKPGDKFQYLTIKQITESSVLLSNETGTYELKLKGQ